MINNGTYKRLVRRAKNGTFKISGNPYFTASSQDLTLEVGHATLRSEVTMKERFDLSASPSYWLRPALQRIGKKWRALYGENPQDGVAGLGDTPHEAFTDFDKRWFTHRGPSGFRGKVVIAELDEPDNRTPYQRQVDIEEFIPTPHQINLLPRRLREYIHNLKGNCDPAGNVATIAVLRENVAALTALVQELEKEIAGRPQLRPRKLTSRNAKG